MLSITDGAEGYEEEETPVLLLPLEDVIFKVKGVTYRVELVESNKVQRREVCWLCMTTFLLPISYIGKFSGDNPLVL